MALYSSLLIVSNCWSQSVEDGGNRLRSIRVDASAESSLKKLVLPSCVIGIMLAWVCLRSIRAAIAVLYSGRLWPSFGDCFRLLHRRSLQRCTDCPADARVHAHLSGAVHLMNYYRDVSLWHEDHLGSRAMLLGIKRRFWQV